MTTLVLTLATFAVVMTAMALGVMVTGRRLQGSCGGVASGSCVCRRQGTAVSDCPRRSEPERIVSVKRLRGALHQKPPA